MVSLRAELIALNPRDPGTASTKRVSTFNHVWREELRWEALAASGLHVRFAHATSLARRMAGYALGGQRAETLKFPLQKFK